MTKTRDEVVELIKKSISSNAFDLDYGVFEPEANAAYDALIVAGVIPQWRPIEKAPKPLVATVSIGSDDMSEWFFTISPLLWNHFIKLTIINGKLEKSEQVK